MLAWRVGHLRQAKGPGVDHIAIMIGKTEMEVGQTSLTPYLSCLRWKWRLREHDAQAAMGGYYSVWPVRSDTGLVVAV